MRKLPLEPLSREDRQFIQGLLDEGYVFEGEETILLGQKEMCKNVVNTALKKNANAKIGKQ